MTKTLLITLEFAPQMGGVATYYTNLCQHLPAQDIIVLAPQAAGDSAFDVRQQFTIIRDAHLNALLTPGNPWRSLKAHIATYHLIRTIIQKHRINSIIVGNLLPLGTIAYMVKQKIGTPYNIIVHGLDVLVALRRPRKKLLARKIIDHAHAIITNSQYTKNQVGRFGLTNCNTTVIHPCPNIANPQQADPERIAALRTRYGLGQNKIIITVGRLVERKGIDMLIKAMPHILKAQPHTDLVVIGEGPYRQTLQNLTNNLGLSRHVHFVGNQHTDNLAAWYDMATAMIMPSRQIGDDVEGFGIVYLEANLYGTPCIGGNSGGVPEAIIHEKTGLIVDPLDTRAIARAALRLLNDSAYAERLGMQGAQRVFEQFTWNQAAKKIQSIITS